MLSCSGHLRRSQIIAKALKFNDLGAFLFGVNHQKYSYIVMFLATKSRP